MSPVDPTQSNFLGHCRWCGAQVTTDGFRDSQALRAYYDEASCQKCQDVQMLGAGEYPIRHGVIVSAICADDCVHEVGLLPFQFSVPTSRIVWEPRFTVRAGPVFDLVNPWVELEAMAGAWREHHVRVMCVPWFTDPLLRSGLTGRKFVIGLNEVSLRVVGNICPNAIQPALVSLSAEIPWQDGYGVPLLPLDPFLRAHALDEVGSADACRGSALRQCALIARLLELRATTGRDAGRTAFDLLLLAHGARFEESVWAAFGSRSEDFP